MSNIAHLRSCQSMAGLQGIDKLQFSEQTCESHPGVAHKGHTSATTDNNNNRKSSRTTSPKHIRGSVTAGPPHPPKLNLAQVKPLITGHKMHRAYSRTFQSPRIAI